MGWALVGLWLAWTVAAYCGALVLARQAKSKAGADGWRALRTVLSLSGPLNTVLGGGLFGLAAYFLFAEADAHFRLLMAGFGLGGGAAPPQATVAFAVRGAYAELRGTDPGAFEMLRQLLPRAALISMPLGTTLMLAVSGSKLALGEYSQTVGLAWAVLLGLLVAVWIVQWRLLQHFTLPGKVVEFGMTGWAYEANDLAMRMRVRLRKLLLVQTRRTRIAGAFALSGGRIAYTDYLLSALEPEEFLAITAHELEHFRQAPRLRLAALLLLTAAAAVGLGAGLFAVSGALPDEFALALSALAAFACFAYLKQIKRRQEDEADDAAIVEVGAQPLMSAIAKTYALNGRLGDRRAGAVHRTLEARLRRIRMHAALPESAEDDALRAAVRLLAPRAQVS